MKPTPLPFVVALVSLNCAHSGPTGPVAVADSPDSVAADMWEVALAEDPLRATLLGDRRFDASLPDLSPNARGETLHKYKELLRRLRSLNPGQMSRDAFITARVMATELHNIVERHACAFDLWRVDQLEGHHLALLRLADSQVIDDSAAATAYLTRLGGAAALLEQHTANLVEGLRQNVSAPQVIVNRVLQQLAALSPALLQHKFLQPLDRAKHLVPDEALALRQDVVALVHSQIAPAYAAYAAFLRTTYLPAARREVSLQSMPQGDRCYRAVFAQYTNMLEGQTAADLHDLGRNELERLQEAMRGLAQTQGHTTTLGYVEKLLQDPAQYALQPQDLVSRAQAVVDRATLALPTAFASLPAIPLEVRALGTYQERDAPAGFYEPAPNDGSRPAIFFLNTAQPKTRPLYNLEALTFHEALPGHHLQMALAQKMARLPNIRRHSAVPSYIEGWGLYAEALADELQLYSAPASRFGRLNFAAFRAARLVVDTGLHSLGWTREQAIAFMRDNLNLPEADIESEIDRYAMWPGQALSYTSGYLAIMNLRDQAQKKLGTAFDLRAFHSEILSQGAVPMPVLRDIIGMWLARLPPGPAPADAG